MILEGREKELTNHVNDDVDLCYMLQSFILLVCRDVFASHYCLDSLLLHQFTSRSLGNALWKKLLIFIT